MKITKEEAENVMSMFDSADEDNGYLAFKAIEAFDFSGENLGYLIYFFKYSRYKLADWKEQSPLCHKLLQNIIDPDKPLTYAQALNTMIGKRVAKDSIELFLKRHVKEINEMLTNMGYPTNELHVDINLKSNE